MSTRPMPVDDNLEDIVIEVESPETMQMGTDDNGLPITVPKTTEKQPEKKAEQRKPAPTLAELQKAREEIASERQRREAAEAAAALKDKELTDLTAQAEADRSRLGKTERELQDRTIQSWGAHASNLQSNYQRIIEAKTAYEAQATSLEAELRSASEAGDHARVASINRNLSKTEAYIAQLEAGASGAKAEAEDAAATYRSLIQRVSKPVTEPEPTGGKKKEEAPPAEGAKPKTADEWIAQFPKDTTGNWLTQHKEFVTDNVKHQRLLTFARMWELDGNSLHSQEFIDALNDKFGFAEKTEEPEDTSDVTDEIEEEVVETPAKAAPTQRKAAPSAPVSRNAAPGRPGGGGTNAIRLTQEQYAVAPELYASFEDLSPEAQSKFKQWSPTAARWQYHHDLQRAQKEKSHRFTS